MPETCSRLVERLHACGSTSWRQAQQKKWHGETRIREKHGETLGNISIGISRIICLPVIFGSNQIMNHDFWKVNVGSWETCCFSMSWTCKCGSLKHRTFYDLFYGLQIIDFGTGAAGTSSNVLVKQSLHGCSRLNQGWISRTSLAAHIGMDEAATRPIGVPLVFYEGETKLNMTEVWVMVRKVSLTR